MQEKGQFVFLIDVYRQIIEKHVKISKARHRGSRKRYKENKPADRSIAGGQAAVDKKLKKANDYFESIEISPSSSSSDEGGDLGL